MRVEKRRRNTGGPLPLSHHDLVVIAETDEDSRLLDLLGQPDSTIVGEVRLSDGYGEHYLLIQPHRTFYPDGTSRKFDRSGAGLLQCPAKTKET